MDESLFLCIEYMKIWLTDDQMPIGTQSGEGFRTRISLFPRRDIL